MVLWHLPFVLPAVADLVHPHFSDSLDMTPIERRAAASLASIFALRMLGLFLVLPVFAL